MTGAPRLATVEGRPFDAFAERPPDPPGGGGGPPGGGAPEAGEPPCPVRALGRYGGQYFFAARSGEIRDFAGRAMFSRGVVDDLFDGDVAWLALKFPAVDRDGNPTGDFRLNAAARWLMRECAALPFWDASLPQRGRGLWPAGAAGDPEAGMILHCGDAARFVLPALAAGDGIRLAARRVALRGIAGAEGGEWIAPGFRYLNAIYRAMPPTPRPAAAAAGPALGGELVRALEAWNWRERSAPLCVAGWIATAAYGAAVPWRPHLLVAAEPGAGKSELAQLCASVSPLALTFNEFSAAGLQQALTGEARTIYLDEAEGDAHGGEGGPAERAIEMIRRLSDARGLQSVRGSAGGQARGAVATGAAMVLAVLPPDLKPQDETRFTRVDLQKLRPGADSAAIPALIEGLAAQSMALWARMIAGRARYLDNLRVFRAALGLLGCTPRQADQPGAILAGFWTLDRDSAASEAQAAAMIAECRWMIATAAEEESEGGPRRCLSHLYSLQPDVWGGGARKTIGQLIALAISDLAEAGGAREHLQSIGIRVDPPKGGRVEGLYIANRFAGLARLFAHSPWAAGKWRFDLARLDGAKPAGAVRIGGDKPRCVWIPEGYLPPPADAPVEAAPAPP